MTPNENRDAVDFDNTSQKGRKSKRNLRHVSKIAGFAVVCLVIGAAAGYVLGSATNKTSPVGQKTKAASQVNKKAEVDQVAAEEPFVAAPIKQSPDASTVPEPTNPLTAKVEDSVYTTYSFTGPDKVRYTKNMIMTKLTVTNTSKQSVTAEIYPLSIKTKNNGLLNATFFAYQPSELKWFGDYLQPQSIDPNSSVTGVVTFEVADGTYDESKAPLTIQFQKLDLSLDISPRTVKDPNSN